tara:strand:+ start:836 stop:1279 length:444 start_codon:yes stop_codon:yes gene_type:complete
MIQSRYKFLKSQGFTSINLKTTVTKHLLLEASINGVKGIFILDTGASNSCIDSAQLEKFNLISKKSKIKAASATDNMKDTQISKKNELKINKWINSSTSIVLFNMDHINNALGERLINKVDGIIGADTLKKSKALIDYEKKRLYLKL